MKAFLQSFLSTVIVGVFLCASCICVQLLHANYDDPGAGTGVCSASGCDVSCAATFPASTLTCTSNQLGCNKTGPNCADCSCKYNLSTNRCECSGW
jgi:hypothetical protein